VVAWFGTHAVFLIRPARRGGYNSRLDRSRRNAHTPAILAARGDACSWMTGSKNLRGGPHHDFFVGGLDPSLTLVLVALAVATAIAALRLSAAAFLALASCPCGLCGVGFANAAPTVALMAACILVSNVLSTCAWRNLSSGPETTTVRGRQKRSCARSANTRSKSGLACPPL
jgi:hypothetical protein